MRGKVGIGLLLCATVLVAGEREIEQLVDQLESTIPAKRKAAADALRLKGREAIPALMRALDRRDPNARGTAAALLGDLGARDAKARMLENLAVDPDPRARALTARGIRKLGGASDRKGASTLATSLRSEEDTESKRELLYALTASVDGRQTLFRLLEWRQMVRVDLTGEDDAFEHLSPLLEADAWRLRRWAIRNAPIDNATPDAWLRRVRTLSQKDQRPEVRRAALLAVFRAAAPNPTLVRPWILESLQHPRDEEELIFVLWVCVIRVDLDAELERALAAHAASPSVEVRTWVARRLAVGVEASSLDLLKKLAKEQAPVRAAAAVSLARRGNWDPPVGAIVVSTARDGDPPPPYERRNLVARGGRFPPRVANWDWWRLLLRVLPGSDAKALTAFEAAFGETTEQQRINLVHALGYIGDAAVPLLRSRLEDESLKVRYCAAMSLSMYGPAGISALPRLIEFLERYGHDLIREAIARIGPEAVAALVRSYDAQMRAAYNAEHDGTVALPDSTIPDTILAIGKKAAPALDLALAKQDLHPTTREKLARLRKRMTD